MPKYRLTDAEVTTLLDALEDAVQYRALLARASGSAAGHHMDVAGRYEDILLAAQPVAIERITVRYTYAV